GLNRSPPHIAIASVRPFVVVVVQPYVKVSLKRLDRLVVTLPKRSPEELVKDRAIETLNESVGLRSANSSRPMLDIVESQVQLVGVRVGAAVFPAVVGQDRLDPQSSLPIEG